MSNPHIFTQIDHFIRFVCCGVGTSIVQYSRALVVRSLRYILYNTATTTKPTTKPPSMSPGKCTPRYIRLYDKINAHANISQVNTLSLNRSDSSIATPNELAAWLDTNPYFPPMYPFTVCTIDISSSVRDGRNRSTACFIIPEAIWSHSVIVIAKNSNAATPFRQLLRNITHSRARHIGIHANRDDTSHMNWSK